MVWDNQKSTHLLCGADGPHRFVLLDQCQILGALSEPISHERVNIHEAMFVLAYLIFVVGLPYRYPVLISYAFPQIVNYKSHNDWGPDFRRDLFLTVSSTSWKSFNAQLCSLASNFIWLEVVKTALFYFRTFDELFVWAHLQAFSTVFVWLDFWQLLDFL